MEKKEDKRTAASSTQKSAIDAEMERLASLADLYTNKPTGEDEDIDDWEIDVVPPEQPKKSFSISSLFSQARAKFRSWGQDNTDQGYGMELGQKIKLGVTQMTQLKGIVDTHLSDSPTGVLLASFLRIGGTGIDVQSDQVAGLKIATASTKLKNISASVEQLTDGTLLVKIGPCDLSGVGGEAVRDAIIKNVVEQALASANEELSRLQELQKLMLHVKEGTMPSQPDEVTKVQELREQLKDLQRLQQLQQLKNGGTLTRLDKIELERLSKKQKQLNQLVEDLPKLDKIKQLPEYAKTPTYDNVHVSGCIGVRGRAQMLLGGLSREHDGSHMNAYVKVAGEEKLTKWEPRSKKGPQSFFNDTICAMVTSVTSSLFERGIREGSIKSSKQATEEILESPKLKEAFSNLLDRVKDRIIGLISDLKAMSGSLAIKDDLMRMKQASSVQRDDDDENTLSPQG